MSETTRGFFMDVGWRRSRQASGSTSDQTRSIQATRARGWSDSMGAIRNDATTTVGELRNVVRTFVRERDWEQFHAPKNLSMALSIEAAELMEHFQWISVPESRAPDDAKRHAIGEEMADVMCYLLALADTLDLDLTAAVDLKMQRNREKYPVQEFRGRYGHDDPKPATRAPEH